MRDLSFGEVILGVVCVHSFGFSRAVFVSQSVEQQLCVCLCAHLLRSPLGAAAVLSCTITLACLSAVLTPMTSRRCFYSTVVSHAHEYRAQSDPQPCVMTNNRIVDLFRVSVRICKITLHQGDYIFPVCLM